MSTPIRLIAKKALSPNIYKSPRSQTFLNSPSFINEPQFIRSPKIPKSLKFSNVKLENCVENDDIGVSLLNGSEHLDSNTNGINITITKTPSDKNKSPNDETAFKVRKPKVVPLINTPERNEMLKHGLVSNLNWNILGKGTFGTVFQALYKDEKVAMKLIKNNPSTIRRESNALKLNNKNIIKALRVTHDVNYQHAMIVMHHCASLDLQGLLDNSKNDFPISIIAKWALDICQALIYCHENGVLHLDVKPKNILLKNSDCLLCDFGNSLNLFDEEQKEFYLEQVQKDLCGGGTVAYTAPELFCSAKNENFKFPTHAADIYSLGITMWQLESKKMPYEHLDNLHSIIYAVVKNGLRPKIPLKSKLLKYEELYISCWDPVPEKRLKLIYIRDNLLQIIRENS